MTPRKWALVLIGIFIAGIVAIIAGYRPIAAAVCPTCYGLSPAGLNVFIEKAGDPAGTDIALAIITGARARVRNFYGSLKGNPRILVCQTETCYQRIGGGGSTGMALLNFALLLSPRGDRIVIASHEISHIELHARLGLAGTLRRKVPQWFDEGLAAVISDDPRYLAPEGAPNRCIVQSGEDLPTARSAWVVEARDRQLYAKAACRVVRWMTAHGGPAAVSAMIERISDGEKFSNIVR